MNTAGRIILFLISKTTRLYNRGYDAFSQADETKLKSQDSELASSMKGKVGTDLPASKQLIDNFEKRAAIHIQWTVSPVQLFFVNTFP